MIAPRRGPGVPARALNGVVALLLRRFGLPVCPGLWLLRTRHRRTGSWRTVPILVVPMDGARYLVAPRGTTGWTLNLRADPRCVLSRGRRQQQHASALGVEGDEKIAALAEYLRRYGWLTRNLFETSRRPEMPELVRLADRHPVFRLSAS